MTQDIAHTSKNIFIPHQAVQLLSLTELHNGNHQDPDKTIFQQVVQVFFL